MAANLAYFLAYAMDVYLKTSEDGSHTIYNESINECYHSIHGAISESRHVFIKNGWYAASANPLNILEVGFGTGLNAFLTMIEANKLKRKTFYHAVELYPLDLEVLELLNYPLQVGELNFATDFMKIHICDWEKEVNVSEYFTILKSKANIIDIKLEYAYNLVFFDAFSPEKEPALWSATLFVKLYNSLTQGAVLSTYCSKGIVKRALREAGFEVKRLPGPKGKRHMVQAFKFSF